MPELQFGSNQNMRFTVSAFLADMRWPVLSAVPILTILITIYISWSYYPPCANCFQDLGILEGAGKAAFSLKEITSPIIFLSKMGHFWTLRGKCIRFYDF